MTLRSITSLRPLAAAPADHHFGDVRAGDPRVARAQAKVVRCLCTECGAHTNAIKTFRVTGCCATCGSFDLMLLEGADPLDRGPRAA